MVFGTLCRLGPELVAAFPPSRQHCNCEALTNWYQVPCKVRLVGQPLDGAGVVSAGLACVCGCDVLTCGAMASQIAQSGGNTAVAVLLALRILVYVPVYCKQQQYATHTDHIMVLFADPRGLPAPYSYPLLLPCPLS